MEVLPYISSYLLIYAFVLNFIFWYIPAPFGKFSHVWSVPWYFKVYSSLFRGSTTLWFVTIIIGWWENETVKWEWPTSDRGLFVFVWLCIYWVFRTFIAPMLNFVALDDKTVVGDKKVFVLWIIPYIGFWAPAGIFWRRATTKIDAPIEPYDYILIFLLLFFGVLNVHSEWRMNKKRSSVTKKLQTIGKYLDEEQIYEDYASMKKQWHMLSLPPNYMFEVAHWFIFIFVSHCWEGLWWFLCIFMFLLTRGVWQKKWYLTECVPKPIEPAQTQQNTVEESINRNDNIGNEAKLVF